MAPSGPLEASRAKQIILLYYVTYVTLCLSPQSQFMASWETVAEHEMLTMGTNGMHIMSSIYREGNLMSYLSPTPNHPNNILEHRIATAKKIEMVETWKP